MENNSFDDIFKKRLKGLRGEMTLQQLADATGINRVTLTNYENGTRHPDARILTILARYFGVSLDYLVGISDIKDQDPVIRMICMYTGLDEIEVRKLHEYYKSSNKPIDEKTSLDFLLADALNMINDLLGSTGLTFSLVNYLESDFITSVIMSDGSSEISGTSFNIVSQNGYVTELTTDVVQAGYMQEIKKELDEIKLKRARILSAVLEEKKIENI